MQLNADGKRREAQFFLFPQKKNVYIKMAYAMPIQPGERHIFYWEKKKKKKGESFQLFKVTGHDTTGIRHPVP
jgi:hypothetical protein